MTIADQFNGAWFLYTQTNNNALCKCSWFLRKWKSTESEISVESMVVLSDAVRYGVVYG